MIYAPERFNELCEEFISKSQEVLAWKRGEYAAGVDRLENFRTVGDFLGKKPSVIALIYLLKHIQSIAVAVITGVFVWAWTKDGGEALKQRIVDAINYLLLLAACLDEESEVVTSEAAMHKHDVSIELHKTYCRDCGYEECLCNK